MEVRSKLRIKLPYVPAMPQLGIYPEKTTILKDTCIPVLTVAVFYNSQDMEADVHQ